MKRGDLVAWFALTAWLTAMAIWAWPLERYTADSWMYWDMAQNIQDANPFNANTVRQFQSRPGLATSFPIGYPLLLAFVEGLIPVGARVGILLNIAMLLFTAVLLRLYLRPAGLEAHAPIIVGAVSLYLPFADEVVAGRAMPTAVAMTVALLVLVDRAKTRRDWIAVGALSSLGGLVRFDLLPILILTAFVAAMLRRLRSADPRDAPAWSHIGLMSAAALACVALGQVGVAAAAGEQISSDNVRTVIASSPTHVEDYLPAGVETIVEAPSAWARRLAGNAPAAARSIYVAGTYGIIPFLVLLAARRRQVEDLRLVIPSVALGIVAFPVVAAQILATSYVDTRYWTPLVVALCIAFAGATKVPPIAAGVRVVALSLAAIATLRLFPTGEIANSWGALRLNSPSSFAVEGLQTSCMQSGDRVMLFDTEAATRLATIERILTSATPSNLSNLDLSSQRRFVQEFGITHVHEDKDLLAHFGLQTSPTACAGLLKIFP